MVTHVKEEKKKGKEARAAISNNVVRSGQVSRQDDA